MNARGAYGRDAWVGKNITTGSEALEINLLAGVMIGLFGTVHCLGMCGGIAGALTAGVAPDARASNARLALFSTTYSIGRITSYTVAGAITGALGAAVIGVTGAHGVLVAHWIAAAFLAALGLYIAGWLPSLAWVERWGWPIWRRLQPLGARLLPVRRLPHALAFGLIWGWLPCGLVYSALLYTLGAGGALEGAAFMFAFGVGTLPSMIGAGIASGALLAWLRRRWVRRAFGLAIIATALTTALLHTLGAGGH